VAVRRGGQVDRAQQVEVAMIAAGRRSKTSAMAAGDLADGHRLGAERLDVQPHRLGLADGVGDLHLAAPASPAATTFLATQRVA
jgi:hypothetical protein